MRTVTGRTMSLAAAFTMLMLVPTGCGGSDSVPESVTGTETANVDNCSLVTDAEATSLAGEELNHGEDSPLGCPYMPPGSSMGHFIVRVFQGEGDAKDNFGQHSPDTAIHEIPGVGDSAAVLARDQHVNFLIVKKGDRYIQFVTTFLDDMKLGSPQLKQAQDLAVTALGRIE